MSKSAADLDKRAFFRNVIQLVRLTTTIKSDGRGPKLPAGMNTPNVYTSGRRYTYLDAVVRLLVRKDEVVAAVQCALTECGTEVAVLAQADKVERLASLVSSPSAAIYSFEQFV
jgi:hypothetical protein